MSNALRHTVAGEPMNGKEWEDHEWREADHFWRNPYAPASLIPVNQAGTNTPAFANYELFHFTR